MVGVEVVAGHPPSSLQKKGKRGFTLHIFEKEGGKVICTVTQE
jgi:hypothetical protein